MAIFKTYRIEQTRLIISGLRNIFDKLMRFLELARDQSHAQLPESQRQPMEDAVFWYIVNRCHDLSGSNARYYNNLWATLAEMEPDQVAAFALKLFHLKAQLNTWNLWAAFNLLEPSPTRELFSGFQNWLISAGRDACQAYLVDPDNLLVALQSAGGRELYFTDLSNAPFEVLQELLQNAMEPALHHLRQSFAELQSAPLTGEQWKIDANSLASRFPRLCSILANNPVGGDFPSLKSLN